MKRKIRIGISACLLGEKCRYDGGHRYDHLLTETLGPLVKFVPVCPEVGCGLPVPREPMRLQGRPEFPRLLTIDTRIDHTKKMDRWARLRVHELEKEGLCGFIFKARSPSCGLQRVEVCDEEGVPHANGVGIFAWEFMNRFPEVPVEDSEGLQDPTIRENFIARIFALKR